MRNKYLLRSFEERRRSCAPLPNFQTGMPSLRALSARVSWMPVPGATSTPIGNTSSMASFRLNGAALAWRAQSGLKAICGTLR
jgi:hypothetical protein